MSVSSLILENKYKHETKTSYYM